MSPEEELIALDKAKAKWYKHATEAAHILSDITTYLEGMSNLPKGLLTLVDQAVAKYTEIKTG